MLKGSLREQDNRWVIEEVFRTQGVCEANKGLLAWPALDQDQGMWISVNVPSKLIHTFGMKYDLDLVYVDKQLSVVKLVKGIQPGSMSGAWRAYSAFEFCSGMIERMDIRVGDRLIWTPAQGGIKS